MNPIAHNLSVSALIEALKGIDCEFVDAMVEGELVLVFRPSQWQGDDDDEEDDDEIDIDKTII